MGFGFRVYQFASVFSGRIRALLITGVALSVALSIPHARAEEARATSYFALVELERQCRSRALATCNSDGRNLIEIERLACEADLAANECDRYFETSGDPIELKRKCDVDTICADKTRVDISTLKGCAVGMGEVIHETVKWAFEAAAEGYRLAAEEVRKCNADPACGAARQSVLQAALERYELIKNCDSRCRQEIANENPSLKNLSPEELSRISTYELHSRRDAFHEAQARVAVYVKAAGARATPLPLSEDAESPEDQLVSGSASARRSLLVQAIEAWLAKQKTRHQCYTQEASDELKCFAFFSVVDPTSALGYAAKFAKGKRALKAMDELVRSSEANGGKRAFTLTRSREDLIKHYLDAEPTTTAQNEAWMKLAAAPKTKNSRLHFLEIENSMLKHLNDTLLDKNLVTSLNNRYKEILNQKMARVRGMFDGNVEVYSDFKSMRYAFDGKVDDKLRGEIEKAFAQANADFAKELAESKLLRVGETDPSKWFRGGFGTTADEASTAARYSRSVTGGSEIKHFADNDLQDNLKGALSYAKQYREQLVSRFKGTLMEGPPGAETLSQDAWELIRKTKSDQELKATLETRFAMQGLDPQSVSNLRAYAGIIDDFSPGLHVARRELATLDHATEGGITADFAGLGADNLRATEQALITAGDLDVALANARQAEQRVTQAFSARKDQFHKIVRETLEKKGHQLDVVCSGDDCVAVPKNALTTLDKKAVVDALASQTENPSGMRLSFVADQVKDGSKRGMIGIHGETIEKLTRKSLEGRVPREKLKGVTFAIDMLTTSPGSGNVELLIGRSPSVQLTSEELKTIEDAFKKSVDNLNKESGRTSTASHYVPAGVR